MTARTIVITGASDGIGASAARTLSRQGEQVVVVGRSAGKTAEIAKEIGADYFVADFAELAQVRELAAAAEGEVPADRRPGEQRRRDHGPAELTVDGHEKTFQVNHLAPFLLTTELMDVLTASNATVINTSSAATASASSTSTTSTPRGTTPPTAPTAPASSRTSSSPPS